MSGSDRRVPFIGLTGGIGSGKSTALKALARLGAHTISADRIVHGLYETDQVRDAVVGRWGDEVAPGGVVDRSAIARRAFADPAERDWLERLLWPLVRLRADEFRRAAESDPAAVAVVVEVPLLFEGEADTRYDATIAVVADEELRAARAATRGHAALEERGARQLSQDEKARRATYAISNDGSIEDLEASLSVVLAKLTL